MDEMRGRHTRRERRREILHLALSTVPIHTHTHIPPLVLMAFSCLVTSLEIPLFQHHLTTYHRHTPHPLTTTAAAALHNHSPPPLLYHKTPPVFLALRTEPNQYVLFCCLGGGSVCVLHMVSFAPFLRLYIFHVVGLYIFFFSFCFPSGGVVWGLRFCMDGWTDGGVDGEMDGGALGIFCMALGQVFVFHFMDGWVAGLVLGWFLVGR